MSNCTLQEFFAILGEGDDYLNLIANAIATTTQLNGGAQTDKLRRTGNRLNNLTLTQFETLL